MRVNEIRSALHRLKEEKWRLQNEYEENGGEVTESTISREQTIADLKTLLMSAEGVDALGRLMRSNQDDIQGFKDEKKYIETQIKKTESFHDLILELTDEILKECDAENVKGNLGYSFTPHTSVTTKVDTKMLKERFYETALAAIRNTDIPQDVTITLSASVSALPEGSELPEWYSQSSVGRATFRKPRKDKEEKKDEFADNNFE
jgi:hypothetical protein